MDDGDGITFFGGADKVIDDSFLVSIDFLRLHKCGTSLEFSNLILGT